jgi:hypothetical protein
MVNKGKLAHVFERIEMGVTGSVNFLNVGPDPNLGGYVFISMLGNPEYSLNIFGLKALHCCPALPIAYAIHNKSQGNSFVKEIMKISSHPLVYAVL